MIPEYPVGMRRLVTVIAVAALVAACGGSSGGSKTSSVSLSAPSTSASHPSPTTTTSTQRADSRPTYRYPASVKNALMAQCRRVGSRSSCLCVLRYFEGNFSYAQIKAASVPRLATWAAKASSICSGV
jgi:hypothetical protein